jgi:hypothetical protein
MYAHYMYVYIQFLDKEFELRSSYSMRYVEQDSDTYSKEYGINFR